MELIYLNEEIRDENNYTEESIEALLEEYDNADKTELTIDDKCDILDYDSIFNARELLKSDANFFYSYTHNRRYAVIKDGSGYIIFEVDNY